MCMLIWEHWMGLIFDLCCIQSYTVLCEFSKHRFPYCSRGTIAIIQKDLTSPINPSDTKSWKYLLSNVNDNGYYKTVRFGLWRSYVHLMAPLNGPSLSRPTFCYPTSIPSTNQKFWISLLFNTFYGEPPWFLPGQELYIQCSQSPEIPMTHIQRGLWVLCKLHHQGTDCIFFQ